MTCMYRAKVKPSRTASGFNLIWTGLPAGAGLAGIAFRRPRFTTSDQPASIDAGASGRGRGSRGAGCLGANALISSLFCPVLALRRCSSRRRKLNGQGLLSCRRGSLSPGSSLGCRLFKTSCQHSKTDSARQAPKRKVSRWLVVSRPVPLPAYPLRGKVAGRDSPGTQGAPV